MKKSLILLSAYLFLMSSAPLFAQESPLKVKMTILLASNEGNDINLVNDAYKDQLINLFSYRSYEEVDVKAVELAKSERVKVGLPEGYELLLTYQGNEGDRSLVQALIRKEATQFVFTVLSMAQEGVAVLGGPPAGKGVLVIVLEKIY